MSSILALTRSFIVGDAVTGANVGSGLEVFDSKVGSEMRFRRLMPGSGMSLSYEGDGISIDKVNPRNVLFVQKNPGLGSFGSIKEAVDSISDNSEDNQYLVSVGPGVYVEQPIQMKSFVYVEGAGDATVVEAANPNSHLITGADRSIIADCMLHGASGINKAAVYYSSPSPQSVSYFAVEHCRFGANHTLVLCEGAVSGTSCIVLTNNVKYGGSFPYVRGFVSLSNGPSNGRVFIKNSSSTGGHSQPFPTVFALASGPNSEIVVNGCQANIGLQGPSLTDCLKATNGGRLRITGMNMRQWGRAIFLENSGVAPTIQTLATTPEACTMDLVVEHPSASGSFFGIADAMKVSVNDNADVAILHLDPNHNGVGVAGSLKLGDKYSALTDVTDLIQRTTPTGAIEGGQLSLGINPLEVNVAAGNGYCENTVIVKNRKVVWQATTLTLLDNSNNFIYVTSNGTVTSALSAPDIDETILLGRAVTLNGEVDYISQIPILAEHHSTRIESFVREALGPVYVAGSVVSQNPASGLHIDVSSGSYFFSSIKFTLAGGSDLAFDPHFHSGGVFTEWWPTKVIDNSMYDNGTDLVPLSSGFYTKHSLYVVGGSQEEYSLVFGQQEFGDLASAQAASLPAPPTDFTDAVVPIAAIIVQQGGSGIADVQDIRPRIGFTAVTVSTANDHGNLTGLLDDDHAQYLLVNGAREMSGNLDMGGNNIVDVGTVDGVDVPAHASRHLPNGADPLTTAAPVSVGTSNSIGTANSLSRSDHIHAHGNQTDGALHAVATSGVAGFMSASDKAKLDTFLDVYKSANEGITSSVALQNDDHLFATLPANSAWSFELVLFLNGTSTASDWKIGWSVPLGTTMLWGPHTAGGLSNWNMAGTGAAPDALLTEASTLSFGSAANTHGAFVRGIIKVGSTAGQVTLQWSQNTVNAAINTVLEGSYFSLRLRKV